MRLHTTTICFFAITLSAGLASAAPKADTQKAHTVMKQKCTSCHGQEKIDAALKAGKDMAAIQKEMEKKGAKLSAGEREVLGIYWSQNPLRQKK